MTLFLEVKSDTFREHLNITVKDYQDLVPVIKGNGYGFGLDNLAIEAKKLNLTTICVGTVFEAIKLEKIFGEDILVLEPFTKSDASSAAAWQNLESRFIKTISALDSGFDFNSPFVIEGLTSTNRFGIKIESLQEISEFNNPNLRGLALHLPIAKPKKSKIDQILLWIEKWEQLSQNKNIWLSHISVEELQQLKKIKPEFKFKTRVGTELWLGDKSFLSAKSVVLAVLEGNNSAGYTQKKLAKNKKLIVVSGGTANGIGLNSDKTIKSFKDRLKVLALAFLSALGKNRAPHLINKKATYFFEPAHMNVSLLAVSRAKSNVKVGDTVELQVRFSTTNFDVIKGLN
jgi:alanine racemase